MKLKAGTYYIGDLCYVLEKNMWEIVCDELDTSDGIIDVEGITLACFSTAEGDGIFISDLMDNPVSVDSGTIGCIETKYISKELLESAKTFSNVVKFSYDFIVDSDDGIISFGDIELNTNDEEEDYDDPWEEDEE